MTTFYVPIEFPQQTVPSKRWFFHVIEAQTALSAGMAALTYWKDKGRRVAPTIVWAAADHCPSVPEMEALRTGFLATKAGKQCKQRAVA